MLEKKSKKFSKINSISIDIKKNQTKRKNNFIYLVKIILIILFVLGFYYINNSYSNSISLLAISENLDNNITQGSILDLNLKVKPGSGKIYINLNTLEEIDTQISIINSQKITCELFNLNCQNYDFYYEFTGSSLILKGPSASSAIAILTAKTVKKEKIENDVVITGSLNSGGIIGIVGGVDEKINIANQMKFKKILVPKFSNYNNTISRNIEVIEVLDLVEAYNNFNSKKYELKTYPINKTNYINIMKTLGSEICLRTDEIKNQVDLDSIQNNSILDAYNTGAQKTFNSSVEAEKLENYYSQGSFCFNSNINYRFILENQKNYTNLEIDKKILELENEINLKYTQIISKRYNNEIVSINDFYVYLILNDRIENAKKIIEDSKVNNKNLIENILINISINSSTESKINIEDPQILRNKILVYSSSLERFYTVKIWEKFILNDGKKVNFDDTIIRDSCFKINKEINIKSELLNKYNINFLDSEIKAHNELTGSFSNKYYCLYKGLETIGKINSVLNSVGITDENQKEYTQKINEFTKSRLSLNSNGNFPLIPFIYYEYSTDLFKTEDYLASILYSNYALVYSDLNLYLKSEEINTKISNIALNNIYENYIFIIAILIIIGFI